MERLVKGDVVVLPFPFSDLSNSKRRPALVLARLKGDDIILAQITSKFRLDEYSIPLNEEDFKKGGLNRSSLVRTNRIFTADQSIILYKVGSVKESLMNIITQKIIDILTKL